MSSWSDRDGSGRGDRWSYRTTHDRDGDSAVSVTILQAVGRALGRDPADLPPLCDRANPDALDELFSRQHGDRRGTVCVTFSYAGCRVSVRGDDIVSIRIDT